MKLLCNSCRLGKNSTVIIKACEITIFTQNFLNIVVKRKRKIRLSAATINNTNLFFV